jgi:hypothetical protein
MVLGGGSVVECGGIANFGGVYRSLGKEAVE